MNLNPFNESNVNDLRNSILELVRSTRKSVMSKIKTTLNTINRKGQQKITVMCVPHSEKKIINFHISNYAIWTVSTILLATIIVTSTVIVNHSTTIKQVSKLEIYGEDSKEQIEIYKKEINDLYSIFNGELKPQISALVPLKKNETMWAKGGKHNNKNISGEDSSNPSLEILNLQEMEQDLKISQEALEKIKSQLENRKKVIENTPSIWPVDGHVISHFGMRPSPYTRRKEFHKGIDISAFPGSEIRATAPGTVKEISWDSTLGLTVTIQHKYGFSTSYSHCQRVSVEKDQKISKGEIVGFVGKTGDATSYICFYQIKVGTEYINPLPYLNKIVRPE